MSEIDCTVNTLICAGECVPSVWPLKTRDSVKFLEKKEVFCSWFQANGLGVETQFPALRLNDFFLYASSSAGTNPTHLPFFYCNAKPVGKPCVFVDDLRSDTVHFCPHKYIFRHMRLSSTFDNLEERAARIPKPRIPNTLLREKFRTARRCMVCTDNVGVSIAFFIMIMHD